MGDSLEKIITQLATEIQKQKFFTVSVRDYVGSHTLEFSDTRANIKEFVLSHDFHRGHLILKIEPSSHEDYVPATRLKFYICALTSRHVAKRLTEFGSDYSGEILSERHDIEWCFDGAWKYAIYDLELRMRKRRTRMFKDLATVRTLTSDPSSLFSTVPLDVVRYLVGPMVRDCRK